VNDSIAIGTEMLKFIRLRRWMKAAAPGRTQQPFFGTLLTAMNLCSLKMNGQAEGRIALLPLAALTL
jgi:hypothetical protein